MATRVLAALLFAFPAAAQITITLTGQSMLRSDLRETAPAAVRIIQSLLKGDVIFTNFEAAIAEKGETVSEGRGFLSPPGTLDALKTLGFNLLAFSDNHAFDFKATGIRNTIREADMRNIVHAGTGTNLAAASAPAYLRTQKGIIALVASASGLIAPGANATADRPGVNELRVEAGGKPNEATADLPGAPANSPNPEDASRILQSIRDARAHADLVIVYQHNH
ncbi:MAG TPA: CapA family protein, partial [Bryobacteraceae bacterium]